MSLVDSCSPELQSRLRTPTAPFTLLQWRGAIKLELAGLRHSSGRSVRKHAAAHLGLRPRAKAEDVLARIDALLAELKGETQ